jgi:hypothetical protein
VHTHGGATRVSAKPHHFLIGAALAALLLGLEESGEATHRNAHVTIHPVTFMSGAAMARRCQQQKSDVPRAPSCPKAKAETGVRPRSN